eukprot:jgi/Tetstr1/438092/TSEL_026716.t1
MSAQSPPPPARGAARVLGRLAGHSDTVLCCDVAPSQHCLASGGEDGSLFLFDLRSHEPAGKLACFEGEAVLSVVHSPRAEHELLAAAGGSVFFLDTRAAAGGGAAPVTNSVSISEEEVNQIVVDSKGRFAAAADDNGDVVILDLAAQAVKRRLSPHSESICCGVAFRPHRPWEVLSGGCDCVLAHSDFSTGRRLQLWDMGAEAVESGGQMFNPPHINSIAVPGTERRPFCRMVAAGRGDGAVVVYDADAKVGQKGMGKGKGKAKGSASRAGGQPESRCCLLDAEAGGHTASVAHVTFPQWGEGAQLLSAGNDRALILWDWQRAQQQQADGGEAGESASPEHSAVAAHVKLKHKANWLATAQGHPGHVFVADTSSALSVLSLGE